MRKAVTLLVLVCLLVLLAAPGSLVAAAMTHDRNYSTFGQRPTGVAQDKYGNVYAVFESESPDICKFSPDGSVLATFGAAGGLGQPYDVEVDRWGNIYVSDKQYDRVSVFSHTFAFIRHISQSGGGPDDLSQPYGIAVSPQGELWVADAGYFIKCFDIYGNHIRTWTSEGPAVGLDCDADGDLWAANDHLDPSPPDYGNTVAHYDREGNLLASWGTTGTGQGQFDRAYDVSVDPAGRVFVIDANNHRAQVFDQSGTFDTQFGGPVPGDTGFFFPYGVDAGLQRYVAVADWANRRVSFWGPTDAPPTSQKSLAGSNRYETAARISQEAYPDAGSVDYVVVATGLNWPDALGGASLCGAREAPLLLTDPNELSSATRDEIVRLGPDKAYVLGGSGAVSDHVYDQLEGLVGIGDVKRLGGTNRYETAQIIAHETMTILQAAGRWTQAAFVATGENFPDALAASPISAANGWPIYLTRPDALGSTKAAMQSDGVTHGYVVGGSGVVSDDVFDDLNATFTGFIRYGGTNRYQTAANLADAAYEGLGMYWSRPAIATGENFPDALTGGVLEGSDYSPLLLTPKDSLHPSAASVLEARKDSIYELRFLGGTGAVSQATRDAAMAHLH
ncbi:MAG: hypothetical protein Kow0056_11660 [Coriobacteriia bacterium]